jgi:hypothetical protein
MPVPTLLFWLYLINLVWLILHEMDSAYWKEWALFRLPGGVGGFLAIHFPLYLAALYGLVEVKRPTVVGLILALVLGAAGVAAFAIHTYFLRRGHPEFNTPASKLILWAWLITSLVQLGLTAVSWSWLGGRPAGY